MIAARLMAPQLLLLAVLSTALRSSPASSQERWIQIAAGPAPVYLDSATVRRESGFFAIWLKAEFSSPLIIGTVEARGLKRRMDLNCGPLQRRELEYYFFDSREETVLTQAIADTAWKSIVPATSEEAMFLRACEHLASR
jgi:hypothetical protein